ASTANDSALWLISEIVYNYNIYNHLVMEVNMINQSLKVFVEVVEQKSFTKAAEILHMTQPAVSGYIKKIEEQLTVNLIDRSGKTIRLSHAGEIYYSYAKEMIVLNDRMENLIQDLQNEAKGPLHIGASYTY